MRRPFPHVDTGSATTLAVPGRRPVMIRSPSHPKAKPGDEAARHPFETGAAGPDATHRTGTRADEDDGMTIRSTTGAAGRRWRSAALLGALTGLALTGLAQAASPRDPSGVWLTEDGKARIRLEKCGAQSNNICGYAVWLKTPLNDEGKPRIDFRNPDVKKQSRPSLGHQLILGLKPNTEGKYEGKIYNAENGKYYDVTLWSDQPGELTLRGCMLAILCGSQTWEQKADVAPGQLTGPTNGANGPRADAEWTPKPATAAAGAAVTTGSAGPAKPGATKPAAPKTAGAKPAAPASTETPPED